jgi:hypothetical protein
MNNFFNRIIGRRISRSAETSPTTSVNFASQTDYGTASELTSKTPMAKLNPQREAKARKRFFTRANTFFPSLSRPKSSFFQKINSGNHSAPPVHWRQQLAMVKAAYYSPKRNADGVDLCTREYCYHRANVLAAMIAKSTSAQVIGWIEGTTIRGHNATALPDSFDYHISALVRDKGIVYLADPMHDGLETRSELNVHEWMRLTLGNDDSQSMEYRFILPTDNNHAGMNTDDLDAMDAEKFESTVKNYEGPVMPATFADSRSVDDGLIALAIFKSAIADHGCSTLHAGKAVVETNFPDINNTKDYLWKKPFSLTLQPENGAPVSDKGHCNEVIAVMIELGRPISERIDI